MKGLEGLRAAGNDYWKAPVKAIGRGDLEKSLLEAIAEIDRRFASEPEYFLPLPSWANDLSEAEILEVIDRCVFGPLDEGSEL